MASVGQLHLPDRGTRTGEATGSPDLPAGTERGHLLVGRRERPVRAFPRGPRQRREWAAPGPPGATRRPPSPGPQRTWPGERRLRPADPPRLRQLQMGPVSGVPAGLAAIPFLCGRSPTPRLPLGSGSGSENRRRDRGGARGAGAGGASGDSGGVWRSLCRERAAAWTPRDPRACGSRLQAAVSPPSAREPARRPAAAPGRLSATPAAAPGRPGARQAAPARDTCSASQASLWSPVSGAFRALYDGRP